MHDFGFFRYDPNAIQFHQYEEIPLAPEAASVGLEIRVIGNDSREKVFLDFVFSLWEFAIFRIGLLLRFLALVYLDLGCIIIISILLVIRLVSSITLLLVLNSNFHRFRFWLAPLLVWIEMLLLIDSMLILLAYCFEEFDEKKRAHLDYLLIRK